MIVETGDYGSATTPLTQPIVSTKAGLDVHGEDGKPRPRIFTNAPIGLDVRGAGSRVRDLEIDQVSTLNLRTISRFQVHPMFRSVLGMKEPKRDAADESEES